MSSIAEQTLQAVVASQHRYLCEEVKRLAAELAELRRTGVATKEDGDDRLNEWWSRQYDKVSKENEEQKLVIKEYTESRAEEKPWWEERYDKVSKQNEELLFEVHRLQEKGAGWQRKHDEAVLDRDKDIEVLKEELKEYKEKWSSLLEHDEQNHRVIAALKRSLTMYEAYVGYSEEYLAGRAPFTTDEMLSFDDFIKEKLPDFEKFLAQDRRFYRKED